MQISTNDQGQTLIYLDKEEWEDYGRRAGYIGEVKTASTEVEKESVIKALQELRDVVSQQLDQLLMNKESATTQQVTIKEAGFNRENFPSLVDLQEKDGLIAPFDKTSPVI